MICVVIGRTRHRMVQIEIQEAAKRGAQMIELRLDFLAKAPDFKRLLAGKPCPLVATVRRPAEGGRWAANEEARRMVLRQAIVAGFDWVDLELDLANEIRRFRNVKRIISYHNMKEVPANLEDIYEELCKQDADVLKVAVTAQQPSDNLRVLSLLKKSRKPTIAICMGELGLPSRILGAKYGAPFTYGAFNKERGIAPGMPSFEDLKGVYYYDHIDASTEVMGLIGDPVAHSISPAVHNSAMRSLRYNGVYVPFRVPRGIPLANFLKDFDEIPVRGYSVTIPHKEVAMLVAPEKDAATQRCKAANTLVRTDNGFAAYNTDYQAAIGSLQAHLTTNPEAGPASLEKRNVLVLGAGGVARAVVHALNAAKAQVIIANRTPERAKRLADEVGGRAIDWTARHNVPFDILINCTSVGMHPNVDESPIHASVLKPGLMVFDTVYTPETTLLIKEARARGCIIVSGVEMFLRQAGMQFQLFTGQDPPTDVMKKQIRRHLSPVTVRTADEAEAGS